MGAGPYWWSGSLALWLACGPEASPEVEGSTAAGASESTADGAGTATSPMPTTTAATTTTTTTTTTTAVTTAADTSASDTSASTEPVPADLPVESMWTPMVCETDEFEANDEAMQATPIDAPCAPWSGDEHWTCFGELTACHGPGDEDWYLLPIAPEATDWTVLQLEISILPYFSLCNCSEDPVPMGPELAATVEVYDAQTLLLIGSVSGMTPNLWLYDEGLAFGQSLLIRVVGPADASWAYDLWVNRQDSTWEDSCEC